MGMKILWGGATLILAVQQLLPAQPIELVGGIIMIIGYFMYLFDK